MRGNVGTPPAADQTCPRKAVGVSELDSRPDRYGAGLPDYIGTGRGNDIFRYLRVTRPRVTFALPINPAQVVAL